MQVKVYIKLLAALFLSFNNISHAGPDSWAIIIITTINDTSDGRSNPN